MTPLSTTAAFPSDLDIDRQARLKPLADVASPGIGGCRLHLPDQLLCQPSVRPVPRRPLGRHGDAARHATEIPIGP